MAADLVIVESPAKARTVGRFLGKKYLVKASMGHVRDLPRGHLGVKVEERFKPEYRNLPDKKAVIKELKEAAAGAGLVYLATDPDREGEAISWHLVQAAGLKDKTVKRVVFHEITEQAIKEAFSHPREIDHKLVNAQQARRILDRLVGYRLSPLLWSKVRRGLSAGRVQSVALRMVVDREREIQAFVSKEYWTLDAELSKKTGKDADQKFKATLHSIKGQKKLEIGSQEHASRVTSDLGGVGYTVSSANTKETRSRPSPPFITSTLQQEAWGKLRFSARKTMMLAQQLYEGISLGKEGSEGLITYMRTDSTQVSSLAQQEAAAYIKKRFGARYTPSKPRVYRGKVKGAQEAHEAIRPTSVAREPQRLRDHLNPDQFRLYDLVWKRMLASQMADAVMDVTSVDIDASGHSGAAYLFKASGTVLKFPGYREVYTAERGESEEDDSSRTPLPELKQGDALDCFGLTPLQHFTQPPSRYSEATLIKALEENGIGRPSTYAPTISTIADRSYVQRDKGRLVPSKLGIAVSDFLTEHFPPIMDTGFTAKMEEELDEIARGEREWVPVLSDFYGSFSQAVDKAKAEAQRVSRESIDEETDEVCEVCERPMVIKTGRFGRFLSCSGFPECKNSKPLLARTGVQCPTCDGELVERRGSGNKRFYGCSNYPTCSFTVNQRPLSPPCPQCGRLLVASGRERARCTSCDFKGPIPQDELAEALA